MTVEVKDRSKTFIAVRHIIAPMCAVILIVIGCVIAYRFLSVNKYNKLGYINTSGRTIGAIAKERGITLRQLLDEYDLPKDMRSDTEEAAAYYTIPTKKIAELNGKDFDDYKKLYGWNDDIKPETPWGQAQDETPLKYMYSSEKALKSFKDEYNLGDNVNGETRYGEVRNIVAQNNPDSAKIK